jgi:hypothetical protein
MKLHPYKKYPEIIAKPARAREGFSMEIGIHVLHVLHVPQADADAPKAIKAGSEGDPACPACAVTLRVIDHAGQRLCVTSSCRKMTCTEIANVSTKHRRQCRAL